MLSAIALRRCSGATLAAEQIAPRALPGFSGLLGNTGFGVLTLAVAVRACTALFTIFSAGALPLVVGAKILADPERKILQALTHLDTCYKPVNP